MLAGDGEHARVAEQDRAHGEVGFLHGQPGNQDVHLPGAEPAERIDVGGLAHLKLPLGVASPGDSPMG